MTHYVLMKFKPGTDLDADEARIRETYRQLDETLDFLHNPRIFRNCVERDSNADLMAVIDLDDPASLPDYLQHPLHLAMAGAFRDAILVRTSFDTEA